MLSSPENYMLRKITNSPFQDYTPPRKITESESFSGLLKPLSLSHTHGATANLLYKTIYCSLLRKADDPYASDIAEYRKQANV